MGMIIQGGTGNGYAVRVDEQNHLWTRAIQESIEHYANHTLRRAFSIVFNQSPTAANDCIFFLQNTDADRNLVIEGYDFGMKNADAADAEVYFKLGDTGTPNAGSTVTPVAINTESQYSADVTCEKGADLDNAGASLSGGTEFNQIVMANVQDKVMGHINFDSDIVLAPNGAISIWATDAGATYYFNMVCWFKDRSEVVSS